MEPKPGPLLAASDCPSPSAGFATGCLMTAALWSALWWPLTLQSGRHFLRPVRLRSLRIPRRRFGDRCDLAPFASRPLASDSCRRAGAAKWCAPTARQLRSTSPHSLVHTDQPGCASSSPALLQTTASVLGGGSGADPLGSTARTLACSGEHLLVAALDLRAGWRWLL